MQFCQADLGNFAGCCVLALAILLCINGVYTSLNLTNLNLSKPHR